MARSRHNSGQVLPIVAIFLPVIIGMAGLSLTVGTVYLAQSKLQNAVDAAALAGAQEMSPGAQAASTSVTGDPGNQADMITEDDTAAQNANVVLQPTQPNTVLATATATVPGSFAALFGHKTFTIKARAVATYGPGPAFDYAVFQGALSSLTVTGDEQVTGNVHSNGPLDFGGNASVTGTCTAGEGKTAIGCSTIQPGSDIPMPVWQPSANAINLAIYCTGSSSGCSVSSTGVTISSSLPLGNYFMLFGTMPSDNVFTSNSSLGTVTFSSGVSGDGSLTVYNGSINLGKDPVINNLALTSFGGNISYHGNISDTGVLYAPEGTITLDGSGKYSTNISGAVVANTVNLNGHPSIIYDPSQVSAVPDNQVALIQ